jgi:hypothetical protein
MEPLVDQIKLLLDSSIKEKDPTRALGHIEDIKELVQKLYYNLWLKYHQSK